MIRYERLGRVDLNVTNLDRSGRFYEAIVGLQRADKQAFDGSLKFLCGTDNCEVVLHESTTPGFRSMALALQSEEAFETLRARLEERGVACQVIPDNEWLRAWRIEEPNTGATFEFYLPHAAQDSPSFVPSVAKIQRIGHVVFTTPRYAETIDFMTRVLAFAASDDIEGVISFMRPHPNPYHHGVGEVELESRAGVWFPDPPRPPPLAAQALIVRNNLTCDAALLKSSAQCFEGFLTLQRERHRTEAGGRRFMQDHLAVVRAAKEFQRAVDGLLVGSLQADKVFVEATRAIQIGDVQVNASQPLISNHGARLQGNESMQPGCERLSALRGHGSRLSALRSDEEQVLRRKLDNGARRLRKVDTVSISHAYIRRRWRARRSDMEAQAALV